MRIKYITNVRIPTSRAHGFAIMKMCYEFAKAGVETKLFIPSKDNNENKADPFEYYKIPKNFEIEKVPSSDLLGSTLKFGKIFYWIDILSFLISVKLRVKLMPGDVLYTRDFVTTLFFSKKNFIALELHDIPSKSFLFKIALKKVKIFFVLNRFLKDDLVSMGINSENIFISPSGVDIINDQEVSRDEFRKSFGLPLDKKIILYSGQFYSWKGVETLAHASKFVPDALFVFMGGAEPEFELFKEKYEKFENVKIVGFQPKQTSLQFMKVVDVLVIPNSGKSKISSHYTSPLKLFEYMTSGVPIVASDLPSIREIVSESECVFAQPDSPESFADAIKRVLNSADLAQSLATNAFNKVKQYSWEVRTKNILKKIESRL